MRILVTGDRLYTNEAIVHGMLGALICDLGYQERVTVLDGECPYGGADRLAFRWGHSVDDIYHERFPPKIKTAAGYHARNQRMVDSGADIGVAFKDNFDHTLSSGGTEDTVRRARLAGIPMYVVSMA